MVEHIKTGTEAPNADSALSRRSFFGAALGGASFVPFAALARNASAAELPYSSDYGPLNLVADETTGLCFLKLPPGFRYLAFGWTASPMMRGSRTPPAHDGMGVVTRIQDLIVLVRNHEIPGVGRAWYAPAQYDAVGLGGTTNLVFDQRAGSWITGWPSLSGTSINCSGGTTPWGSWLSCEETVSGPEAGFQETHGWVFEVPGVGPAHPVPLTAMGRFVHEAVAVEPVTGYVYETEDRGTAGFYRFIPNSWGALIEGGQLQMLKSVGADNVDLSGESTPGTAFDIEWVDIVDPERAHSPGTSDTLGVFMQGFDNGGASFSRLEGCWHDSGNIYFVSTNGGAAGLGQVWQYDPSRELLTLLYASFSSYQLNQPDNVAVSPRGGIVLCEDGGASTLNGERLIGLTPDGQVFPFAENAVPFFERAEWSGACFSPDGRWLFANLQLPGITVAITGPWCNGAL